MPWQSAAKRLLVTCGRVREEAAAGGRLGAACTQAEAALCKQTQWRRLEGRGFSTLAGEGRRAVVEADGVGWRVRERVRVMRLACQEENSL